KFPSRVFARTPFTAELRIQNLKKVLPSFSFRVRDTSQGSWSTYIFKLVAGDSTTERFETVFPERGQVQADSLVLQTTFPFGFFNKVLMRPPSQSVLVYPNILPIDMASGNRFLTDASSGQGQRKGQGINLHGLREYTPQDDARAIHWKASARETRILLKEFERDENQDLLIFFSNHLPEDAPGSDPSPEGRRIAFERAVKMAASLAVAHRENGHSVVLETLEGKGPVQAGNKSLDALLRELALIQPVDRETAHRNQSEWMEARGTGAGGDRMILILPAQDPMWEGHQGLFSDVWVAESLNWEAWEAREEKAA
ncbi:MAG TPA: DUF58 domain-containing protein, partial [Nitrospiria bacterium]